MLRWLLLLWLFAATFESSVWDEDFFADEEEPSRSSKQALDYAAPG